MENKMIKFAGSMVRTGPEREPDHFEPDGVVQSKVRPSGRT
jgi:hypothetical protein